MIEPQAPSYQRQAIERALQQYPVGVPIRIACASAAVTQALVAHEAADRAALARQHQYRRWGHVGLVSGLVAGILGGALLAPESVFGLQGRTLIGLAQALALLVAFLSARWLIFQKPLRRWLENRADAERKRGALFRQILEADGPVGAYDHALGVQKVQVIMAAHLSEQLQFYANGCERYGKLPDWAVALRWLGYLLGAVAVTIAVASVPHGLVFTAHRFGQTVPVWLEQLSGATLTLKTLIDAQPWQLAAGTMASSLIAFVGAWSLLHQTERNLCLYTENKSKLQALIDARAPSVSEAAANGRLDEAAAFLARAQEIIEAEHSVWKTVHEVAGPQG